MQIIFMNPVLKSAYDIARTIENFSPEERAKFYRKKHLGEREQVLQMLMGYVTSLFDILKLYENNQEVEAYRQMCGIDLHEMGLDNFECKYEKPKN